MQLMLDPQQQGVGDRRKCEQHHGNRKHFLTLQELHGVYDQRTQSMLGGKHFGEQNSEECQGEAYSQTGDYLGQGCREKHGKKRLSS